MESNFHKYNEQIYYELINTITNTKHCKYKDLHMQDKREQLGFSKDILSNKDYTELVNSVLLDLLIHGVVDCNGGVLSADIPVGTDLFEYLRDNGII